MEEKNLEYEHFPRCSAIGFNVEERKKTIREKLVKPIRFLRDANFGYVNIEKGDLSDKSFINETQKNYAFLYAAYTSDTSVQLQKLYRQGTDVNFRYLGENFNALHLSALHGSYECTRWLLEHGCQIVDTSDGLSPLHFAALDNSLHICRFFFRNGCKIDSKALHIAVWTNAIECFEFFLALRPLINEYDESGFTVFHIAVYLNHLEIIERLLLSRRVDVNVKTKFREYTALHLAAENGYVDCAKILVRWGANVNALSANGQTPLHLACRENFLDCVECLLEERAAVNACDTEGRTPLHAAVSRTLKNPFQIHIVRRLIDRGADVHLADHFGYTALHVAAINGLEQCVERLILSGANVAAETAEHKVTALNIMNRKTPNSCSKIRDSLDTCLSYNREELLKFNFQDINRNSTVGEVNYLYTLQKEGQATVLEHPISKAFLHLKWQKVRIYVILRLVFSVVTTVLLSLLISWGMSDPDDYKNLLTLVGKPTNNQSFYDVKIPACLNSTTDTKYPQSLDIANFLERENKPIIVLVATFLNRSADNVSLWQVNFFFNETNSSSKQECVKNSFIGYSSIKDEIMNTYRDIPNWIFLFIMIMLLVNTVRIIFTLPAYKSLKNFFIKLSNLIEILVTVSVPLNLINMHTTIVHIHGIDDQILRKSLAGLTLLCSWAYLMITASQYPAIGAYFAMFRKVLKEFLIMNVAFFSLLMGFTFTFCMLKPDYFQNPIIGFAKIIAMMSGELNAKDLMEYNGEMELEVHVTAFVLSIFTVIITIVLMNLLVGISVGDVEVLRKNAELTELIQQTKLIHIVEKCCLKGFFPPCMGHILRYFLYVWPDSHSDVVMHIGPKSPNETRLPRDVIDAGMKIALNLQEAGEKPSVEDRFGSLEEHILRLEGLVHTLLQVTLHDKATKLNSSVVNNVVETKTEFKE